MQGKWFARPIGESARVEILDHQGCLVCVTNDNHAEDIVALRAKALTLDAIHAELDGTEWDSGTMSVVASHLLTAGYKIRAANEDEEEGE